MIPVFTLRQLAYFVAAAEDGTIAGAAARLRVSPSAMSDAITELESAMQESLCVRRRGHGFALTSAGERLVSHSRRILAEAEETARSLGGEERLTGPVTIGCYPTLAPTILPPLLQDFAIEQPGIDLMIHEATQDHLTDDLLSGTIDLAVVYNRLIPGNVARARLYESHPHIVLSANHPLANHTTVKLEQLVDEHLILLDTPPSSEHTASLFAERGLRPHIRHRTTSYEVVRTLVARELGYGVLVSPVANPRSYENLPIVERPIVPTVPPVGIDMIWDANKPLPARVRALIAFSQEVDWPS